MEYACVQYRERLILSGVSNMLKQFSYIYNVTTVAKCHDDGGHQNSSANCYFNKNLIIFNPFQKLITLFHKNFIH